MPSPLAGVYCPAIVPDFLNVFKSKLDYEGLKCRKLTDLLRNECADFLSGMSDVHTQYWTEVRPSTPATYSVAWISTAIV